MSKLHLFFFIILVLFLYGCKEKNKFESNFICNKNERICIRSIVKDTTKLKKIELVFFENKINFLNSLDTYTEFNKSYDINFYIKESKYMVVDNKDRSEKVLNLLEQKYLNSLMSDLRNSIKEVINDTLYFKNFRLPVSLEANKKDGNPPPSLKDIYFDYYYNDITDNFEE